jgi:hypothetical protein
MNARRNRPAREGRNPEERGQTPIPPTAPLIDVWGSGSARQRSAGRGLADPPEAPEVYPFRDDSLAGPPRGSQGPSATAPLPTTPGRRVRGPKANRRRAQAGGWVGFALGVLAALAGLTVAALTLGRPFLPTDWLP